MKKTSEQSRARSVVSKRSLLIALSVLVGLILGVGESVATADISVTSWNLVTQARRSKYTKATDVLDVVTLPLDTVSVAQTGDSRAETHYDFWVLGNAARFRSDCEYVLSSESSSGGRLFATMNFTISDPVNYSFEGMNTKYGPQVNDLKVTLKNSSTDDIAFHSWQQGHRDNSNQPVEKTYYLGLLEADEYNELEGSISGVLTPGDYELSLSFGMEGSLLHAYPGEGSGFVEFTMSPPIVHIDIDIKPGSYPNAINLGSQGVIPVAILSSADFDATTVDPSTVELSGAEVAIRGKAGQHMAQEEDVNADELLDLVCKVETENLDPDTLQVGYAVLTASTYDGRHVEGSDEITIVPPQ